MSELLVGGWAEIVEAEIMGIVISFDENVVVMGRTDWDDQPWRVPRCLVVAREHPKVEAAAHAILDILRSYDPSWGQNDTSAIRRKVVLEVLRTTGLSVQ